MHMVIDFEPCDECKEKYADYILLVEARQEWITTAYSSRQGPPKPTGRWAAIRKEFVTVESPSPIAFVEPATMNRLLAQAKPSEVRGYPSKTQR